MPRVVAVDTETTGTDFWHGCGAFMVTACDGSHNYVWQGEVDPYDRSKIYWDHEDLADIQELLNDAASLIFHNAKFDMRALSKLGLHIKHLWPKVEDTIIGSHCLNSGESHALKYLALKYLDYSNIEQRKLKDAVLSARNQYKLKYDIAQVGHKCFPALKGNKTKWWAMDYWLCPQECEEYGTDDVEMTWLLWSIMSKSLKAQGLIQQYETRKQLLEITYNMEEAGVNMYVDLINSTRDELEEKAESLRVKIERDNHYNHRFDPTKNDAILFLLHEKLKLPVHFYTDTGRPSASKDAINYYIQADPNNTTLKDYAEYRKCKKLVSDINSYELWITADGRLHPNVWITGTRETRQSVENPNLQNTPKTIRHLLGPRPGMVWLDFDLVNIEMRIWTYEVGNPELTSVFESGGSVHLLIASIIHPELWELHPDEEFKDFYPERYQYTKNGNFAIIYGATSKKADDTYRKQGAYDLISARFPEVPSFTKRCIQEAEDNYAHYDIPYVTTLGGYRVVVPTDELFKSVNYKIQGSAGWMMTEAMINVANNPHLKETGGYIINQIHDSLIIELPESKLSSKIIHSIEDDLNNACLKYIPTSECTHKVIRHVVH